MAFESGTCWQCGHQLQFSDYHVDLNCPSCATATRVCRNCRHYRPGLHNDCMETQADRVMDKARPNRCDWFQPGQPKPSGQAAGDQVDNLRAAAEDLFK